MRKLEFSVFRNTEFLHTATGFNLFVLNLVSIPRLRSVLLMDAFIGLIFIVAIIYGACKLLSSDNQQSDNNTDQTDSSKSQDSHSPKSTSDTTPKLSKEEIEITVNEAKTNQHHRADSTKTTVSKPQQALDTTKPSPRAISTPTAYYEIKKTSEDAKLKQNSPFSSGNTSVITKSKTTGTYQSEYEKRKQEIDEGIKNGTYRVTQVPGNARTNKPSAKSKKPSNLQPSTKQSYSKPPTKPNSDEINPDKLDSYPLPQERLLLTQYYKTHYFQSNSCGEIPLDEVLCPKDGHILFRADTFYKSQLHKQVLCCQKCHTIYPYEKIKYVDFTEGKHILFVCKTHSTGKKHDHKVISVTGFLGIRGGNKIQVNIAYCYDCHRFYMYYEQYKIYQIKYGRDIMGDIFFLDGPLFESYSIIKTESILHKYGYNVNVNSKVKQSDRLNILEWLLDHNILTKDEIIKYLSGFIKRGEKVPSWHLAVTKWKSDLEWIQDYELGSQQSTNIVSIRKWN